MNIRTFVTAAALLASFAGAAAAQTATDAAPANSVGKFLYDQQGDTVGSVRRLSDGGRSAVIMIGFVGQPGSHEVTVPASALDVAGGKVVLRAETMQALNVR
jgi:hypothetical protein